MKNAKDKYREYLNSNEWTELKAKKKQHSSRKTCPACSLHKSLQVHHMLYRGDPRNTQLKDLLYLCGDCHKLFHQMFGLHLSREFLANTQRIRGFTKKAIRVELYLTGKWKPKDPPNAIKNKSFMELYTKLRTGL